MPYDDEWDDQEYTPGGGADFGYDYGSDKPLTGPPADLAPYGPSAKGPGIPQLPRPTQAGEAKGPGLPQMSRPTQAGEAKPYMPQMDVPGPKPPPPPPPRPFTQADSLRLQRLNSELSAADRALDSGEINEVDHQTYVDQIMREMQPLQQRQQMTQRQQQAEAKHAAMDALAMQESVEAHHAQRQAQDFHKTVADYTDTLTGKAAHFYQAERGKWVQIEFPEDKQTEGNLQGATVPASGWSNMLAGAAIGANPEEPAFPWSEGMTPEKAQQIKQQAGKDAQQWWSDLWHKTILAHRDQPRVYDQPTPPSMGPSRPADAPTAPTASESPAAFDPNMVAYANRRNVEIAEQKVREAQGPEMNPQLGTPGGTPEGANQGTGEGGETPPQPVEPYHVMTIINGDKQRNVFFTKPDPTAPAEPPPNASEAMMRIWAAKKFGGTYSDADMKEAAQDVANAKAGKTDFFPSASEMKVQRDRLEKQMPFQFVPPPGARTPQQMQIAFRMQQAEHQKHIDGLLHNWASKSELSKRTQANQAFTAGQTDTKAANAKDLQAQKDTAIADRHANADLYSKFRTLAFNELKGTKDEKGNPKMPSHEEITKRTKELIAEHDELTGKQPAAAAPPAPTNPANAQKANAAVADMLRAAQQKAQSAPKPTAVKREPSDFNIYAGW